MERDTQEEGVSENEKKRTEVEGKKSREREDGMGENLKNGRQTKKEREN